MILDRLGMGMSVACAIHCAALPLIAGAALLSHDHALHSPWLDVAMIGIAGCIGYATLGYSFRRHRHPLPLVLLTAGLALIVLGHMLFAHQSGVIAIAGALLLVVAQVQNRRCPAPCCASGTCIGVSRGDT